MSLNSTVSLPLRIVSVLAWSLHGHCWVWKSNLNALNSPSCSCPNPFLTTSNPYSYQSSPILLPHPISTSTPLHQCDNSTTPPITLPHSPPPSTPHHLHTTSTSYHHPASCTPASHLYQVHYYTGKPHPHYTNLHTAPPTPNPITFFHSSPPTLSSGTGYQVTCIENAYHDMCHIYDICLHLMWIYGTET